MLLHVIFSLSQTTSKFSRFLKFFRHRSSSGKGFDPSFSLNSLFPLKMSGAEGQRATSPPSIQFSWSSDEVEVVGPSARPEPPRVSVPAQGRTAPSRHVPSSGRENLPMDELPSILQETDLQSFSQEYNIRPDSYELIRCHGDHRADHFFHL